MDSHDARPRLQADADDPTRLRLHGQWTLATDMEVAERLREVPTR